MATTTPHPHHQQPPPTQSSLNPGSFGQTTRANFDPTDAQAVPGPSRLVANDRNHDDSGSRPPPNPLPPPRRRAEGPIIVPTVIGPDGVKQVPQLFEHCPVEDLIALIASMLDRLIEHNDRIPLTPTSLTRFHSRAPPSIGVRDYLLRIARYTNVEPCCLLILLPYVDKVCARMNTFTISSLTVHRFIIAAVSVGSKALSDAFCTNGRYSRVGGVSIVEMNLLEKEFCEAIDWRLTTSGSVLAHYYTSLVKSHPQYRLSTAPLPEPELFVDLSSTDSQPPPPPANGSSSSNASSSPPTTSSASDRTSHSTTNSPRRPTSSSTDTRSTTNSSNHATMSIDASPSIPPPPPLRSPFASSPLKDVSMSTSSSSHTTSPIVTTDSVNGSKIPTTDSPSLNSSTTTSSTVQDDQEFKHPCPRSNPRHSSTIDSTKSFPSSPSFLLKRSRRRSTSSSNSSNSSSSNSNNPIGSASHVALVEANSIIIDPLSASVNGKGGGGKKQGPSTSSSRREDKERFKPSPRLSAS
ncbi:cyclin family protein [Sporobolomyces koalae]|uniref:cyclin family protein n=1 Tax=Sporobolomyces koalae TaxID=500713 RepID=UPI00317AB7ED